MSVPGHDVERQVHVWNVSPRIAGGSRVREQGSTQASERTRGLQSQVHANTPDAQQIGVEPEGVCRVRAPGSITEQGRSNRHLTGANVLQPGYVAPSCVGDGAVLSCAPRI